MIEPGVIILIDNTGWLQHLLANPQMRIFCLPHAGGGSATFHTWRATLPQAIEICPLLLPGREVRISESLFTAIEPLVNAMTNALQQNLKTPYAIFGHSMGALLAFELVRQIERNQLPVPVWLFLSGRRAPHLSDIYGALSSLPDNDFLRELIHRYNGVPQEILDNSEARELFLPILRADIAVIESYSFQEKGPIHCLITAFAGAEDASVTSDQLSAWSRHTNCAFDLQLLPGGHFYPQAPCYA
jgi:surfactin synthase thioesterase subunit